MRLRTSAPLMHGRAAGAGRKYQANSRFGGYIARELATRMGVDQSYASSLEAGKRNPTVVTLWHAAVALGVTPDRFLKQRA